MNPDKERIYSLVCNVLNELLGDDGDRYPIDTELDYLAVDSLDVVEVALELEDQLGIEFDESALPTPTTVGDLVDLAYAALHPEGAK